MNWRYPLISILILGGGIWLWFLFQTTSPVKNTEKIQSQSGPILFFGDSLVEGVGATEEKDMPSLLARGLGESVLNYGVSGDTTALALARIDAPLQEHPRLVIVLLGGNDFLRRVPRETTALNLEKIITAFQNQGAVVLLLGVRSGVLSGGSDEFYKKIAEKTGAAYEPDILEGIFGDARLMSDAIHPNDQGYAKIMERLLPKVKDLLGK